MKSILIIIYFLLAFTLCSGEEHISGGWTKRSIREDSLEIDQTFKKAGAEYTKDNDYLEKRHDISYIRPEDFNSEYINETRALIASSNQRGTENLNLKEFFHLIFGDNDAIFSRLHCAKRGSVHPFHVQSSKL